MKIEITAGGVYGRDGKELGIGDVLDLKEEPKALAGRYRVVSGGGRTEGKTAVTNPAEATGPKLPLEAKDTGGGWYTVTDADGAERGKKLRKEDAEAFNALSDEDKLALLKDEA